MKAKDLKQWDLFFNTNGYVCLVYKTTGCGAVIVNTNGTFYTAKKDSNYEYTDDIPDMSTEEFFMNFPMTIFQDYRDRERFEAIKASYYAKNKVSRLLLLC